MEYRQASQKDIESIAAIHADSWRRTHRGVYADSYLDGDVLSDRLAVWESRLERPDRTHDTVVAVRDGEVIGFVHTILDHHSVWGALLDNLHVTHAAKGQGAGTQLMARSAAVVLSRGLHKRLYLLVQEKNVAAQAFYQARGGTCVGRHLSEPPGGGIIVGLRYTWPDPAVLLRMAGPNQP